MNGTGDHLDRNFFRAENPDHLLASQRPAIQAILKKFARIAIGVLNDSSRRPLDYAPGGQAVNKTARDAADINRPHHVFCIDGGRGSGKTYTLLSLDWALHQISDLRRGKPAEWRKFFEEPQCIGVGTLKALEHLEPRLTSVAHVLRIIFPGDMVAGESVMEMIFAAMNEQLAISMEVLRRQDEGSSSRRKKAEELRAKLRDEVERGWYFARRFGLEAIIRDSADYRDLIERFEEESQKASNRIKAWRDYMDEYLDFHHAATLVILLDDSDVQAELTHDILHSIRMFLNHPRIVSVLAGNIRSMRNSLLHISMQRIAPSIKALENDNRRTAIDWRQIERKAVEDYLEKVLPPAQRLVLRLPELGHAAGRRAAESDFEKIAGKDLLDLCIARTDAARAAFLSAKFSLAIKRELNESDAPTVIRGRELEEFLSWWVFGNRYAASLAPRSARQIATFRELFAEDLSGEAATAKGGDGLGRPAPQRKFRTKKRLTVMLHDIPENYALIQRLGDQDANFVSWIRQQETESNWVGQRMFRINQRESYHRHYTYDYIRYRLDVGLAMPLRDNTEEMVPAGLLPRLRGRRYMRRFFQPGQMPRQQRRYGVARWIDHAAVPGNCIYLYDLAALPDISMISDREVNKSAMDQSSDILPRDHREGSWEASLPGRWVELIQDEQDELMLRYFTEIVCERLKETGAITSAAIMLELNPLDIRRKYSHGVYERFLQNEVNSFAEEIKTVIWSFALRELQIGHLRGHSEDLAQMPLEAEGRDPELVLGHIDDVKRMIALYAALVTDLRRAWHAVRIHEIAPGWMGSGEALGSSQEQQLISFAVIASQSHMPLYSRKHLEERVLFSSSPWLRHVREVFSKKHVVDAFNAQKQACDEPEWDKMKLEDAQIASLYNTPSIAIVQGPTKLVDQESAPSAAEEIDDYGRWAETLRYIGRAICAEWPYCAAKTRGKNEQKAIAVNDDLERRLFDGMHGLSWRLDVSGEPGTGQTDGEPGNRKTERRQHARDARNFAWLLFGLAPSLPAIIHTELMAKIYEAESRRRLAKGEKDKNVDDALVALKKAYDDVQKDIEAWAGLNGLLSVLLRYIKIKCLHIFAKLFIKSMLEDQALSEEDKKLRDNALKEDLKNFVDRHPDVKERPMQRARFLQACRIEVANEQVALKVFGRLKEIFGAEISDDLAMMPDAAPSTLFGELWMVDLVTDEIREQLGSIEGMTLYPLVLPVPVDNPKDVRGTFGETEQWLWATNRFLRKFNTWVEKYKEREYKAQTSDELMGPPNSQVR